jgi:16S rRNA (adenine1518-N6/adenine1519-N6)-dimethyltransferase
MKIQPKKSLGQNFLKDKTVADKIIRSVNLSPADVVIEIGPGEGVLTEELAKRAGKVIAIEIDNNLVRLLRNKLSNKKNVEIITDDILKINLEKLITDYEIRDMGYKVIANLPYYITSPIIRLFLETRFPPSVMILMVQKEVAERIVSRPGKMSILAVSVQYYAHPELLFYVDKNAFYPAPKVDSAVIHIACKMKHEARDRDEAKKFFGVVRAGFSAKRKMLSNNLASGFHLGKKEVEEKLKKSGISPIARAQELSIEDWRRLTRLFSE